MPIVKTTAQIQDFLMAFFRIYTPSSYKQGFTLIDPVSLMLGNSSICRERIADFPVFMGRLKTVVYFSFNSDIGSFVLVLNLHSVVKKNS